MVKASLEVLRHAYNEAKDILHLQSGSLANFRSNAATILGFDGVILGIGVAGFTFLRDQGLRIVDFPFATIPIALATLAILVSTFLGAWCLLPKRLVGGLPAKKLVEVMEYEVHEPEFIGEAVLAYERFIQRNWKVLKVTAIAQSGAAWALVAGIVLYGVGIGVLLYGGV